MSYTSYVQKHIIHKHILHTQINILYADLYPSHAHATDRQTSYTRMSDTHGLIPRRLYVSVIPSPLLFAAPPLMAVAGCNDDMYVDALKQFCLTSFQIEMQVLGERLWCDWGETLGIYSDLTNCTHFLAEGLDCFWPNQHVDHLFSGIHKDYFKSCAMTGRLPADPPYPILCSFIIIPILITLLMTALVVWRSKRSEGIV
ncbi:receptor activity-modifying protein 1 [Discoglossus pictus]